MHLFQTPQRCLWVLTVILLLALGGMLLDILLRSANQDRAAATVVLGLGISWVALAPSGTAMNRPETNHCGMDLRFSPQIPFQNNPMESNRGHPQAVVFAP